MITTLKVFNHRHIYKISYKIYYIMYILSLIGVSVIAPTYLKLFINVAKIYISLLLLWKFNPFHTKYECTKYDKELIFSSALFLLLTTTIGEVLISFTPTNLLHN